MPRATKSVTQPYSAGGLDSVLSESLILTYNAIEYGERNCITNRKGMKGFYQSLRMERIPSCYKVAAMGRACSILESRKKSARRGVQIRHRKPLRPMVCLISGYFITAKRRLFVPLRRDRYFDVQLNRHVVKTLKGMELRSLTITSKSLSFCYSENVDQRPVKLIYGIDRNEKNLTFGNAEGIVQIDMADAVRIRQTTREILGSFRRNDARVMRKLARKYRKRCNDRTNQMLHAATNFMVEAAARNGAAFAIEDLKDIKKMYQRGNGQGNDYRFRLNSWAHGKAKHMLEYKSAWNGIEVIQLTRSETSGSSSECSACGERLRSPERADAEHKRMLWCRKCRVWVDRDVNAAINLSTRGLARFTSSRPPSKSRSQQADFAMEEKGLAGEAMRGNLEGRRQLAILRVDASKIRPRV